MKIMNTEFFAADLLGMALPRAGGVDGLGEPEVFERPRACVITGQMVSTGYRARDIIPATTSEFLDLLHGDPDGVMSPVAARVYKSSWNMGSWLVFSNGDSHHPLVDRKAALAQERPCWSDLARTIWPARAGDPLVAILTTDTKKRIWEKARIGVLGSDTPVLVYNMDRSVFRVLSIDWPEMLECLDLVERVYALGFSKTTIAAGLYVEYARMNEISFSRGMALERELRAWRSRPEFEFVILIAQKESTK